MESGGEELLGALFNHRVTHNSLVGQLSDKLSAGEATILIDRLTALLVAHQVDNNTYRNVVELLTILVDGCAQKMLWDNECHDAIRRAADCITEQVLLADTISMFNYHLSDDSSRLRSENDVQYSDYIVESVLLADTISMFNYHLSDDSSRLRSENDVQYSDYIVESVTYQCRSL
ncbi:hypothetical protein Tcan_03170 [Toxocara canis]|uniref:Uncharacterized protein n=1 Tax=Toxocara canis TaxID=6265 RepID=A0A0B2V7X5_TOXCA|nr:hypothetical protein Tcan_03170 [Toxocara canis]